MVSSLFLPKLLFTVGLLWSKQVFWKCNMSFLYGKSSTKLSGWLFHIHLYIRKLSPWKQIDIFSFIIPSHHVRNHVLLLVPCVCSVSPQCFWEEIEYAHSSETQHFSFTLIIALCYDKLAFDRSVGFVFGVITKRHTWQLITNPVSNKEVSISAVASTSSRNVSYWTLINFHVKHPHRSFAVPV